MDPHVSLWKFEEAIRMAESDCKSEKFVRNIIEGIAETCPMELLLMLAHATADYRRKELAAESEQKLN